MYTNSRNRPWNRTCCNSYLLDSFRLFIRDPSLISSRTILGYRRHHITKNWHHSMPKDSCVQLNKSAQAIEQILFTECDFSYVFPLGSSNLVSSSNVKHGKPRIWSTVRLIKCNVYNVLWNLFLLLLHLFIHHL